MPSTPSTTASPSSTKCFCLILRAALDDPGIAAGPIVAPARDQAHAVAVALQAEAIPVVFYLVKPIGAVRDCCALGRQAKLK